MNKVERLAYRATIDILRSSIEDHSLKRDANERLLRRIRSITTACNYYTKGVLLAQMNAIRLVIAEQLGLPLDEIDKLNRQPTEEKE